jgi:hypothetical protein
MRYELRATIVYVSVFLQLAMVRNLPQLGNASVPQLAMVQNSP